MLSHKKCNKTHVGALHAHTTMKFISVLLFLNKSSFYKQISYKENCYLSFLLRLITSTSLQIAKSDNRLRPVVDHQFCVRYLFNRRLKWNTSGGFLVNILFCSLRNWVSSKLFVCFEWISCVFVQAGLAMIT